MKKKSKRKKERSPTLPKQSEEKDIEKESKEDDGSSRNTSRGRRSLSSLFRRSADSRERALSESPDRTKSAKSEDDENIEEYHQQQNDSPNVNPRINPRKHLGRMTVREALVETKSRGRSPGKHIVKLQKSVLENKPRDSLSTSLPHILDQFPGPEEVKHKNHDPQSGIYTLPRSKRRSRAEKQKQGNSLDYSKLEANVTQNENKILPLDKRKYMIKKDKSPNDMKDTKRSENYSKSRSPHGSLSRDISPYNYSSSAEQDNQRRDTFTQFMQLRETRPSSRSSTISNDKLSAFTPIREPRISPHGSAIQDKHSPSNVSVHQRISPSNAPRQFRSFPQDRNTVFKQPTQHHVSKDVDDIPKSNDIEHNENTQETKNKRGMYISPRRFSRNSRSSETSDTLFVPIDNASISDDNGEEVRKFKYHRQFSSSSEKARQRRLKQQKEKKEAENELYKPIEHNNDRPENAVYKRNSEEKESLLLSLTDVPIQTKHEKEADVKVDTHESETLTLVNDTESLTKPTVLPVKTVKSSSDVPNISQENVFVPINSNDSKKDEFLKSSCEPNSVSLGCNDYEIIKPVPLSEIMDDRSYGMPKQKENVSSEVVETEDRQKQGTTTDDIVEIKGKKKSKLFRRKTEKKSDKKSEKKTEKKSERKSEKKKKKLKSADKKEEDKPQEEYKDEDSIEKNDTCVSFDENCSNKQTEFNLENCKDSKTNYEKEEFDTIEKDSMSRDTSLKRSSKKKKKEKRSASLKSIKKKHKESDAEGKTCRSSSLTSIPMADVSNTKRRQSSVKEKKIKLIKRSRSVENISKKENAKPLTRSKTLKKPPSSLINDDKKEIQKPLEKDESAKPDKPAPKLSLGAIITMRAKISRMKKAREEREAAAAAKKLEEENEAKQLDQGDAENGSKTEDNDNETSENVDTEQDRERVFYENEINASIGSQSKMRDSVHMDEDILSLDKEVKDIVYEKRIHFSSYGDDTISEEEMIKQRQRNTRLTGRRESKVRLRQKKFIACCKSAIAFLFSHIGLCSLVIGYCIAGGFIFRALEGEQELKQRTKMENLRKNYTDKIYSLAFDTTMNKGNREDFRKEVSEILKSYSQIIFKHTKEAGWDGNDNYGNGTTTEVEQWSFPSSLLYAITVMTTIGYGHVAPKTPHGRIVTIAYAVLGIPLTLLCLTNIGDVMAHGFRLLYGKVFCGVCCVLFRPPRRKRIDPEKGIPADDKILVHDDEKSEEVIHVPTSVCLLLMSAYIMLGTLAFCRWEGWDVVTGTYFCFITLSTIGFGDVVPGMSSKNWNKNEKLVLCGLYLLFGLSLIAMCFNLVQEDVKAKCKRIGKKLGIIDK